MAPMYIQEIPRTFYVWIDPKNWLTRHQIQVVGSFSSVIPDGNSETLMFLPNPKFEGTIGVFQNNLLRNFTAEYNLELGRVTNFKTMPSRLHAIFLFESANEAQRYRERHGWHVGDRLLREVTTSGPYAYSAHDCSWVDFLRLGHSMDAATIDYVSKAYWRGLKVEDSTLESFRKPWSQSPIMEILFIGRIEFIDRSLPSES